MAACSTTRRNSRERSESMEKSQFKIQNSEFRIAHSHLRLLSNGGQLTARRTIAAVAEQIVGLHQFVDFARAFVDDCAFAVPVEPSHGVLVRIAIGAVDLDGIACGPFGGDGGKPFGEAGLAGVAAAVVLQPARAEPQQPRRLVVGFHLGDHFLHQLVLSDLDTEGLPLERVLHAGVAARANQAGRARSHREPPLIEREHRNLEAFADAASTFSSGTSMSAILNQPVLPARMPHFSFIGPLENPLNVRSTMNAVRPDGSRCFFFSASVQAMTMNVSATSASEIQLFSPFSTYRSPRFVAVVCMPRKSLPADGSVSPYPAILVPCACGTRYRRFCCSDPHVKSDRQLRPA